MTDQEYKEAMEDMFSTQGWKVLVEDLIANYHNINSVDATKDVNDLFFRKGQLNILAFLVNLESTIAHNAEEGSNEGV